MKIHARPDSATCFANTSAIDSGDACSCQPCAVTSTQRIHAGASASPRRRRRRSPSRQRASVAAASVARRAQLSSSSLRSAVSASSAARRSSAAASASSSVVNPSRSAAARCASLPGVSPSARRSLRIAGPMSGGGVGQPRHFARAGAGGDFGVARELRQLPGGHLLAEEQRRGVGKLVGLVEDHRVARGQELGEPFVAQHHVGEEQMMIDDDDVGVERGLARLQHEAVGMKRAAAAEAVVARRRDERPDRRVLRDVGELAAVAGLARARKRDDLRQVARVLARRQPALGRRALEMVVADVVGAPLEERERHRRAERGADERQVALEELVLQRLRARSRRSPCRRRAARGRGRRTSCRCRCRPRREAACARRSRARPHRPSRVAADGSGIPAARGRARLPRRRWRRAPDPRRAGAWSGDSARATWLSVWPSRAPSAPPAPAWSGRSRWP